MPYVIAEACIDVMDRACVDECPVDCIYQGGRKLYIHPVECIDCGACEPVCPAHAISQDRRVPEDQVAFVADSALFFTDCLQSRDEPIGVPGGARATGVIGVDTDLVRAFQVA